MLTEDQADIIHGLAARTLTFDGGLVVGVPPGFELAEVADALAALEAERDGAGARALVVEYLRRLAPDLEAGAIDAEGTPSAHRLAKLELAARDLLLELGEQPPGAHPRRWTARRGKVEIDLPGWIPLEVLDALARIGEALAEPGVESAWSAPSMAYEAERQSGEGRRARAVLEEVGRLLQLIDPSLVEVTAANVTLAATSVRDTLADWRTEAEHARRDLQAVRAALPGDLGMCMDRDLGQAVASACAADSGHKRQADDTGWQGYISREGGPDRTEATARRMARRANAARAAASPDPASATACKAPARPRPKPRQLSAEDLATADAESAARHELRRHTQGGLRARVEKIAADAARTVSMWEANHERYDGRLDLAFATLSDRLRAALEEQP